MLDYARAIGNEAFAKLVGERRPGSFSSPTRIARSPTNLPARIFSRPVWQKRT